MTQDPHVPAEGGAVASPFSPAELQYLHAEDLAGGKAVALLMAAIFIVGVVLYSFVDWWVS